MTVSLKLGTTQYGASNLPSVLVSIPLRFFGTTTIWKMDMLYSAVIPCQFLIGSVQQLLGGIVMAKRDNVSIPYRLGTTLQEATANQVNLLSSSVNSL